MTDSLKTILDQNSATLVDFKVVPGNSRSLTASKMNSEAIKVAEQLFDDTIPHSPPVTGLTKRVF